MKKFQLATFSAIALGALIAGLGLNAFNIANRLAKGSVTGASIFLKLSLGWDPGLVTLLVNLPLLALSWRILDDIRPVKRW